MGPSHLIFLLLGIMYVLGEGKKEGRQEGTKGEEKERGVRKREGREGDRKGE